MKRQSAKVNLPKLLKDWREKHGYTQVEASRILKCHWRTYQKWEYQDRTPGGMKILEILQEIKK